MKLVCQLKLKLTNKHTTTQNQDHDDAKCVDSNMNEQDKQLVLVTLAIQSQMNLHLIGQMKNYFNF